MRIRNSDNHSYDFMELSVRIPGMEEGEKFIGGVPPKVGQEVRIICTEVINAYGHITYRFNLEPVIDEVFRPTGANVNG
jgi:hypothetical protein